MKHKSVSIIAAILCGTVLAFAAFPVAFAQKNEPEVILTLEGNYKGQVTFVLTGDTVRYEHRTIVPIYPAPTDVTVDGKPWKDLDQPFKLGFTPDFEDVTAKGKIDGSKVTLFRGPDRVELTLRDPEGAVRYQMQNPADPDPPAVRATHFAVPLIVKNIHSSSRPVLIPMGPNQIKLQSERERRAELEIALKVLEEKPVTPEISRSRTESIDMLRRQIDDADRNIRRLEELAEKEAALDDLDSDEAKADEDLQKLLEFRNKMEADIQALEQDPAADRKQISQMRQNLLLYDGMLKNARVRLANGAISLKLGPVSSNERDGVTFPPPEAPWQTAARPGSATTQTSGPAASKADVDRKQQDLLAGVPLWNPEQDGPPEIRLRELVNDTAKRAEANLRSIGAVITTSIDAEHSAADVDFFITDDFRKIVCFIDEIEKTTPRLRWRRVEIRVEPVGGRAFPEEKPKTDARKFRMLGQIRVIRHTPAKKETVPAAGDSASAKEKVKKEPVYPGDPDFLAKLYDLTLALPEEALVTNFRFNNGNCDLTIQTETARIDLERRMVFPYWRIGRMQQRIMADVVSSSVSLIRNDDSARPQKDSVTRADKIDAIVALNIFDPDRAPKKSADSGRPAASTVIRGNRGVSDRVPQTYWQVSEMLEQEISLLYQLLARSEQGANDDAMPYEQHLQRALARRAVVKAQISVHEQTGEVPKVWLEKERRRLADLDGAIDLLKELVEKEARTGEPASSKADVDRKQQDLLAGVPLWDKERDGQPERRIRDLVNDAAKRAEADLKTLSAVRITSIDAEHSYADIDFTVTDEFGKIVRFIDEVEKQTPRLSWRRVEIRVEPAGRTISGDKPKADATQADAVRKYRLTGQIRVITYTPAKKEIVAAAGDSASAKEKAKQEPTLAPGDPDFLAKLYDLSLALPEEALVTNIRFNSGNCDLTIQMQNRNIDLSQRMQFPYWAIGRMQQRIISDDVCSIAISLVKKEFPSRLHQVGATRSNKVDTIVALNIFDPDRAPKKSADSVRPAVLPGSMVIRSDEILKRQLEDVKRTRTELESLLNSLQQTQGGITKEQTDLIRQRIEVYDQQIERIQEQLKALQQKGAEFGEADLERQLQEAVKNHAELDFLHRTLEQTPGGTKEQIDLVRQRLERSEQRVKLLQDKLKKLRP